MQIRLIHKIYKNMPKLVQLFMLCTLHVLHLDRFLVAALCPCFGSETFLRFFL